MNTHLLSDIVRDVRVVLDQNQAEQGVLSGNRDTLELDELIEQKTLHAARIVLENAPLRMLCAPGGADNADADHGWLGKLTSPEYSTEPQTVDRPEDFLRMVSAFVVGKATPSQSGDDVQPDDEAQPAEEESDEAASRAPGTAHHNTWNTTLTHYELVDSDAYSMAKSVFPGIKANRRRPALFYNPYFDWFEFYGSEWGKGKLWYIKLPKYVVTEGVKSLCFPDVLYDAMVYEAASLVETAYKNLPAAQLYSSIARGYMGIEEQETTNKRQKTESK